MTQGGSNDNPRGTQWFDQDAVAVELGMPADWREQGFDTAETMNEMYRIATEGRGMKCPYPDCGFIRNKDLEAMFRHVHGEAHRHGH